MWKILDAIRLGYIENAYLRPGIAERIGNSPADATAAAGDDGPMIAKIKARFARKFRSNGHR
jgi:hypothetical protein